jgi:hypothetical protein
MMVSTIVWLNGSPAPLRRPRSLRMTAGGAAGAYLCDQRSQVETQVTQQSG